MITQRRLCYISRCYYNITSAGNKAKIDNETTFAEMGAVNLGCHQKICSNKLIAFLYNLFGIIKYSFSVRNGDMVLLQYPVKKYYKFICALAHHRHAKVVAFIHDLGCFRRKKLSKDTEIRLLSKVDHVIATNPVMQQWLQKNGLKVPASSLFLHDYRSHAERQIYHLNEHPNLWQIIYAGQLRSRKNSFLYNLNFDEERIQVLVYGRANDDSRLHDSTLNLMGHVDSETFIATAQGHFGLIWDGDSVDTCQGDFGEYLAINTPHKLSFYLRAGLPIIVWSKSAMAPIVLHENIGICVDSLSQIPDKLDELNLVQYNAMLERVACISKKLSKGESMKEAVRDAVNNIKVQVQ